MHGTVEELDSNQGINRAHEAYKVGDYAKAAEIFQNLVSSFESTGDEKNAGEMANNASVSFLRAGDPEQALSVLQGKPEIFESLGDNHGKAISIGNQAAAYEALKKHKVALDLYLEAAEIFAQEGDIELYKSTMQSLSALQLRDGKPFDALTTMKIILNRLKNKSLSNRFLANFLDIPYRLLSRK